MLKRANNAKIAGLIIVFHAVLFLQPLWGSPINSLQVFDSLAHKVDEIRFTEGSHAKRLIAQLYSIANHYPENQPLRRKCLYYESELNYMQGAYDSLLARTIQVELQSIDMAKDPFYHALMAYSLAMNNITKGNYGKAFTLALHATDDFKQLNDSIFIMKSLMLLGRTCIYIENLQMAEKYYAEAKKYTTPERLGYYQIYANMIYITCVYRNRLDDAIDSLLRALPFFEKRDRGLFISVYLNMGEIYYMKQEYDRAYEYFTKAEEFGQSIDNLLFFSALYQTLGTFQIDHKNFKSAYHYFQKAKAFAEQTKNPDLIVNIFHSLSYIHEQQNNTDSALFYLKAYDEVRKEIDRNANPVEAYQSYISVFLEASLQELVIKEQKIALRNKQVGLVLISAIGLFILIVALLIILRQQTRHKEAEKKDLEERLQAKQQIQQLQEERIAIHLRELTSYSLALSTKNNILQQIATAVQRLPKDKSAVDEIRQVIKNNLSTDKVWADFVLHFEKVHPAFFDNIKAHCATLSETDLRLCAYFRIGLSVKQIAQILNVSPESIKTHRYRIKKKLNLPEESNLDDFIRNI